MDFVKVAKSASVLTLYISNIYKINECEIIFIFLYIKSYTLLNAVLLLLCVTPYLKVLLSVAGTSFGRQKKRGLTLRARFAGGKDPDIKIKHNHLA